VVEEKEDETYSKRGSALSEVELFGHVCLFPGPRHKGINNTNICQGKQVLSVR